MLKIKTYVLRCILLQWRDIFQLQSISFKRSFHSCFCAEYYREAEWMLKTDLDVLPMIWHYEKSTRTQLICCNPNKNECTILTTQAPRVFIQMLLGTDNICDAANPEIAHWRCNESHTICRCWYDLVKTLLGFGSGWSLCSVWCYWRDLFQLLQLLQLLEYPNGGILWQKEWQVSKHLGQTIPFISGSIDFAPGIIIEKSLTWQKVVLERLDWI